MVFWEIEETLNYPNPGDAGLASGCALYAYYQKNLGVQHEALKTFTQALHLQTNR